MKKEIELETIVIKGGCRHGADSSGISLVEWFGVIASDGNLIDIGRCKKCGNIVARFADCGRYYTLKMNVKEGK